MNKLKKIGWVLGKLPLSMWYVLSEKRYLAAMERRLRRAGFRLLGHPKFIARDVKFDLTDPGKITIGDQTVITSGVTVLCHDYAVECGLAAIGREDPDYEAVSVREVTIGAGCFIGQMSFLKPGCVIGDRSIIGAGSVVGGVIPPGSVAAGNPARVICKTSDWAQKKWDAGQYQRGARRRRPGGEGKS